MAEPSAAPSCPLDVPDEDWAEAVRREESLMTSGTPRAAQGTLTQQPQHWVESHDRGTTPTVLRSCRGESHDPGKMTPPPVDDTTDPSVFAPARMKPANKAASRSRAFSADTLEGLGARRLAELLMNAAQGDAALAWSSRLVAL